jgi:hypothetical protein
MAKRSGYSRRRFIGKCIGSGSLCLTGMFVWVGCDQKKTANNDQGVAADPADPCSDLSEVSESDIAVRQKLGYVKESPIAENQCHNCNLYLPAKSDQPCGGCMLFKGPVYLSAYCTYWAPKI